MYTDRFGNQLKQFNGHSHVFRHEYMPRVVKRMIKT